jgi:hypothetical protein
VNNSVIDQNPFTGALSAAQGLSAGQSCLLGGAPSFVGSAMSAVAPSYGDVLATGLSFAVPAFAARSAATTSWADQGVVAVAGAWIARPKHTHTGSPPRGAGPV